MKQDERKPTVWEVDVKEEKWVAGLLGTLGLLGLFSVTLDWRVLCVLPALYLGLWLVEQVLTYKERK